MVVLADVARRVGVSTSTASRALNRPELVRPEIVARVREAATLLGYAPNPFARSLRLQDSRTIGLIVPDNTNPFFAEVAKGVEEACFRAGYTLILCNSDRSLEKEAAQARVLHDKRVDGVLLFTTSDASGPTISWLQERSLPVVILERRVPGAAVDCVVSDNTGGARAAVRHLADRGHRRIACMLGDLGASHYRERLAAFRGAMGDFALDIPDRLVRTDLVTYADGQRAAIDLLEDEEPPTAIFCATDTLAIGAIRGAALIGRQVPGDVSIVGYGDIELGAYIRPSLTTVAQEKLAVGANAVRILLRRQAQRAREKEWRPRTQVIATRLVVRESTGDVAGATLRVGAAQRQEDGA